jgi:hypothetical protein
LRRGYQPTINWGFTLVALALPENIRLGRKWQKVTNTLAYQSTELITDEKRFMKHFPELTLSSQLISAGLAIFGNGWKSLFFDKVS